MLVWILLFVRDRVAQVQRQRPQRDLLSTLTYFLPPGTTRYLNNLLADVQV